MNQETCNMSQRQSPFGHPDLPGWSNLGPRRHPVSQSPFTSTTTRLYQRKRWQGPRTKGGQIFKVAGLTTHRLDHPVTALMDEIRTIQLILGRHPLCSTVVHALTKGVKQECDG
jgi:hypothetical protein